MTPVLMNASDAKTFKENSGVKEVCEDSTTIIADTETVVAQSEAEFGKPQVSKTCERGKDVEISTTSTCFVEPQKIWEPHDLIHCEVRVRKLTLLSTSICQMGLDLPISIASARIRRQKNADTIYSQLKELMLTFAYINSANLTTDNMVGAAGDTNIA
ncbi:hypothetical protein BIW11_00867 [Tropilaelaps mercedesae]|uniref:Uncharacterized protein n=1 Tax=Tropilaelaps mercedesae TaxID=418985 RepID=A0A1V9XNE1_9ACAR|nr:hypothetical protein BIW11_00867 [Tropilaelaps mercedesae]